MGVFNAWLCTLVLCLEACWFLTFQYLTTAVSVHRNIQGKSTNASNSLNECRHGRYLASCRPILSVSWSVDRTCSTFRLSLSHDWQDTPTDATLSQLKSQEHLEKHLWKRVLFLEGEKNWWYSSYVIFPRLIEVEKTNLKYCVHQELVRQRRSKELPALITHWWTLRTFLNR